MKIRNRGNKRNGTTIIFPVRVTPEEHDELTALARYLGETAADMIRRLINDERARLVASGKKPPRR